VKKILIITYSEDNECIDMVKTAVKEKNGGTYRFNTDLFPTGIQLSLVESNKKKRVVITGPEGELNLEEITGIWYRRVRLGDKIPQAMDPELRKASILEARTVFFGFLESVDTFILDRVSKIRIASHKQLQLQIAKKLGLKIPRTLTSNNPGEVREFFPTCKHGMITKMLASFSVYEGDKEKVVFTNLVKEEDLEDLDGLSFCPMTFQENVPKKLELRITIVGNQVFTASLDSKASQLAQNDWRKDGLGLIDSWEAYSLPSGIETKLLQLMDYFALNYGAVDMIVTPDNKHVFLEINPAGEFFWLETYNPKFPISRSIADVLLGEGLRR
jgi:MvdD family ATP-grasp ribosomal peptide maturase